MSRKNLNSKSVLIATRVTPHIKDIVTRIAEREGLNVAEWMRNLVVAELKKYGALPTVFTIPGLEEK